MKVILDMDQSMSIKDFEEFQKEFLEFYKGKWYIKDIRVEVDDNDAVNLWRKK